MGLVSLFVLQMRKTGSECCVGRPRPHSLSSSKAWSGSKVLWLQNPTFSSHSHCLGITYSFIPYSAPRDSDWTMTESLTRMSRPLWWLALVRSNGLGFHICMLCHHMPWSRPRVQEWHAVNALRLSYTLVLDVPNFLEHTRKGRFKNSILQTLSNTENSFHFISSLSMRSQC